MTHIRSIVSPSSIRPIVLLLTAFLCLFALSARAQEFSAQKVLTAGVLVPKAVGMAMAGDTFDEPGLRVAFAKKLKASTFLKAHDAHLASVSLLGYSDTQLDGMFVYENELGQRANYGFGIGYKATGENQYQVRSVRIDPFEPLAPRVEAYFVPADRASLKEMRAMSVADLLRFARENSDPVRRDAPAGPMRDYAVVAFCMERLMDGAGWEVISTQKAGTSWSKDGWHVSVVDAALSVNGPEPAVFQAYHTMAKKSPLGEKTFLVATIVNQYLPPMPPGPSTEVAATPEMQELLKRYRSKALPNMQTND